MFNIKGQQEFERAESLRMKAVTEQTDAGYDEFQRITTEELPKCRLGMILGYGLAGVLTTTGVVLIVWSGKRLQNEHRELSVQPSLNGIRVTF